MFKATVNENQTFEIELPSANETGFSINGKKVDLDAREDGTGAFHALVNNNSYRVELVEQNPEEKLVVLKINGTRYSVKVADPFDELLHSLGMDKLMGNKANDLKAPMPGLVLNILVSEGQQVKKGDGLLVLEAMKMENILKAPADCTVKKVVAEKGKAVEKNQVLIQFE